MQNQIEETNENKLFLPDHTLSPNLFSSNDLTGVVSDKDLIVIVVPSHVMRAVTQKMSGYLSANTIMASASKGIEQKTHLTMSGVIKETLPEVKEDRLAVISGPSFAKEVAQKMPTSVTVACKNAATASLVQHVFATAYFRVYTSDDIIGVELGGSVKNVVAIAAGMLDGLGLGLNTRALVDLNKAIDLDPGLPKLYQNRASVLRGLGREEEADKDSNRAGKPESRE